MIVKLLNLGEPREYTIKDIIKYNAYPVGEQGNGRVERHLVCSFNETPKNGLAELYYKDEKLDKPRLKLAFQLDHVEGYIYRTQTEMGFRGSFSFDFSKSPVVVLLVGTHAQGTAGRMGSGQNYIIMIPAETPTGIIACGEKHGRYYDNPGTYCLYWDKDQKKVIECKLSELEVGL